MKLKILCFGGRADGHFNALISQLSSNSEVEVLDDSLQIGTNVLGHRIIGGVDKRIVPKEYIGFVLGIGDNYFREYCYSLATNYKITPLSTIHPSATISPTATIGKCCFIGPNVNIGASVTLGDAVIINSNTTVEHDSHIHDYVHIAPGCSIAGRVTIEEYSFIGIGTSIIPDIKIGSSVVIGAGSAVVDNIDKNIVAFGVKAKPRKLRESNIYSKHAKPI